MKKLLLVIDMQIDFIDGALGTPEAEAIVDKVVEKMKTYPTANIVKNPRIWIPPTLASAITGPIATCIFKLTMNGAAVSSGMGTCGLVGQIGVYTGWVADVAAGTKAAITAFDWIGLVLICFVLPAILSWFFGNILRKAGWIKENDLKLM